MWFNNFIICIFFCFTSALTTSFDFGGVISGNRMAGVPLGRSLGDGEVDVEGICTGPGMACQNCTHAVTCVPLPIGWLKVPLNQCPGDQSCNAHLGQCSTTAVPECDIASQNYDHTCEQVGIFPDAYDCRKFHLCSPPVGLADGAPADHRVALCPRHYGYNPQTAQCSILLKNGQCTHRPVPECQRVGHSGVLEGSLNHYYVCLSKRGILTPQIFICPHGWQFANGFCRSSLDHMTTETLNIEPQTSTTEKEIPTTISRMDKFFSTDKPVTYAADTFLADKFDLSNYETLDEAANSNDFSNSIEDTYGRELWE